MSKPIDVTDTTFKEEVLDSSVPVLVDFWAAWCMPCKMTAPILEEFAKDYENKVKVVKVNVDENQQMAGQYGITGIPSLLFFKNGEVAEKIVGLVPKEKIAEAADKILN